MIQRFIKNKNLSNKLEGMLKVELNMEEIDLSKTFIADSDFTGTRLYKATVERCFVNNTKFDQCNFGGASLDRSYFIDCDFSFSKANGASMKRCVFVDINFENAEFRGADLSNTTFIHCNLKNVKFDGAILKGSTIIESKLSGTRFSCVDMDNIDFYNMDFEYLDFTNTNLNRCRINSSRLFEVNFTNVTMKNGALIDSHIIASSADGADFTNVKFVGDSGIDLPWRCPEEGSFTEFFKVDNRLITLRMGVTSKRVPTCNSICRCDHATVTSISYISGESSDATNVDSETGIEYRKGMIVSVPEFDDNPLHTKGNGICFFLTKKEALDY